MLPVLSDNWEKTIGKAEAGELFRGPPESAIG
jgi:hypothetical protein